MKTIEEKAKAYDEIIPKLKEWHDGLQDHSPAKDTLELILPQFRDSEDEKIRKVILKALLTDDAIRVLVDGGVYFEGAEAYLKRHKEHVPENEESGTRKEPKPVLTAKEAWKEMRLEVYAQASGNRHEPNCSDDSTKMFSLCDIDEIFEKIGDSIVEQNPISSCDIVPYIDDAIAALQDMWREEKVAFDWDDMHEMIEDVARHFYQKEQKPAWSEFDKGVLEDAISATDILGNDKSFNEVHPNFAKAFRVAKDWLKSLPERFSLQPKAEWSEEEKDNISILLCMIDSMDSISLPSGTLRISGEKRRELKEFVKRPSWKPSEEQMRALGDYIDGEEISEYDMEEIVCLYYDLKKLCK